MRATHTPGPWGAEIDRVYGYPKKLTPNIIINPVILGRAVNVTLAKIPRGNGESYANARLISAAPELLAALRAVISVADRQTYEFDLAHAAIAKAEGVGV